MSFAHSFEKNTIRKINKSFNPDIIDSNPQITKSPNLQIIKTSNHQISKSVIYFVAATGAATLLMLLVHSILMAERSILK
jgi:hypothetical protein